MFRWRLTCDNLGFRFQGREKLRGHHLCGALNHSLPDTRNRATQLQIAGVFDQRAFALFFQLEIACAFQESGRPFAVDDDAIVFGWPQIREPNVAIKDTFD